MPTGKTNIAWSLETTGFSAITGQITATGFARPTTADKPGEIKLFLNADGRSEDVDSGFIRMMLSEQFTAEDIALTVYDSENALLSGIESYVEAMDFRTERLVTYNGEKWTGGFALPFVRTRCVVNDAGWIFENVPHLDLAESIQTRFNTQVIGLDTMTTDELASFADHLNVLTERPSSAEYAERLKTKLNDVGFSEHDLEDWADKGDDREVPAASLDTLVGSHGMLVDWDEADDFDPCADGGEVVNAFNEGEFMDVALHMLADVLRVGDLAELVDEYVCDRYLEEVRL